MFDMAIKTELVIDVNPEVSYARNLLDHLSSYRVVPMTEPTPEPDSLAFGWREDKVELFSPVDEAVNGILEHKYVVSASNRRCEFEIVSITLDDDGWEVSQRM